MEEKDKNALNILMQYHPKKSSLASVHRRRNRDHLGVSSRLANSKGKIREKTGKGSGNGSMFVSCPLCGDSVYQSLFHSHADRCFLDDVDSSERSDDFDCSVASKGEMVGQCQVEGERSCPSQQGHGGIAPEATGDIGYITPSPLGRSRRNCTGGNTGRGNRNTGCNKNVFGHMMERSRMLSRPPLRRLFRLNSDMTASWLSDNDASDGSNINGPTERCEHWSATILIKCPTKAKVAPLPESFEGGTAKRQRVEGLYHEDVGRDLELLLSSCFPSLQSGEEQASVRRSSERKQQHQQQRQSGHSSVVRLVQRHSRLSVPVLKSMLQKSIRRRRPLPSVKLAMELHDKSWEDLIRRLPVIILEDSFLHPQFPLLVWLMVAGTKGFVPPPSIVGQVMQIIFEVASCPWRDRLPSLPVAPQEEKKNGTSQDMKTDSKKGEHASHISAIDASTLLTRPSFLENGLQSSSSTMDDRALYAKKSSIVMSILLRAMYGGMVCDVTMLKRYAHMWYVRFRQGVVPSEFSRKITDRLQNKVQLPLAAHSVIKQQIDAPVDGILQWWDVPSVIHAKVREQALAMAKPLMLRQLETLVIKDVCLAGVDFHCSSIMEHIFVDESIYNVLWEGLPCLHGSGDLPFSSCRLTERERRIIEDGVKKMMWVHSSGVNLKVLLDVPSPVAPATFFEDVHKLSTVELARKKVWQDIIKPRVDDYAEKYVASKMSFHLK